MLKACMFSLLLAASWLNSAMAATDTQPTPFTQVTLSQFIADNQISEAMAAKKERLMLPPSAITFKATLMASPKPGQFSLVYDALSLWPGDEPLPNVSHSAYLQADNGHVLPVYVADKAATQLAQLYDAHQTPTPCTVFAVHIYNYAKGPRIVVLGALAAE